MSDFTINSLTAGTLSGTDNLLKSDSEGALTKISGAQLKTDLLGNSDYSKIGDTVSEALMNGLVTKGYNSLASSYLDGNIELNRHGAIANFFIGKLLTANITTDTVIATLPDGFRSDNFSQAFLGFVIIEGVLNTCTIYVKNDELHLSPHTNIPSGSMVRASGTYLTAQQL